MTRSRRGGRVRSGARFVLVASVAAACLHVTHPAQAGAGPASTRPARNSTGTAPVRAPGGADLDGDGVTDLVVAADGAVAVALGSGVRQVLRAPAGDGSYGRALATGDFDGDGHTDLAVGAPWRSTPAVTEAGSVWIHPGGPAGVRGTGSTAPVELHQDSPGMPGSRADGDWFGHALAAGDLTGDGVDDLVVGAVYDSTGGGVRGGTITVVPGGPAGLERTRAVRVSQATRGVAGVAEDGDRFGNTLAVGDVTGDGRPDLVVSAVGENGVGAVHLLPAAGRVPPTGAGSTVVGGRALGIRPSPRSVMDPEETGSDALLGWSLAVADVGGDGTEDVVAGAFLARVGAVPGCGLLAVLDGGPPGLRASSARVRSQSSSGVPGGCESGDLWAYSLAAGDLTGDGQAEIVVGAPFESVGTARDAGAYTVLVGGTSGPGGGGAHRVSQATGHVPGSVESGDGFAWAVGLRDADADGRLDVVATAPFELVGTRPGGMVATLISGPAGRPVAGAVSLTGNAFSDAAGRLLLLGLGVGGGGGVPAGASAASAATRAVRDTVG